MKTNIKSTQGQNMYLYIQSRSNYFHLLFPGVRQEQDLFIRLIDSVAKTVSRRLHF